jgi:hypothetical protein
MIDSALAKNDIVKHATLLQEKEQRGVSLAISGAKFLDTMQVPGHRVDWLLLFQEKE